MLTYVLTPADMRAITFREDQEVIFDFIRSHKGIDPMDVSRITLNPVQRTVTFEVMQKDTNGHHIPLGNYAVVDDVVFPLTERPNWLGYCKRVDAPDPSQVPSS